MKTDMQNVNSHDRIINLSSSSTYESYANATLSPRRKIRIQGRVENVMRTKTKSIVKNTILAIAMKVNEKTRKIIEEIEPRNKFNTIFTDEHISQMALMLPSAHSKALSIRYIQEYFPFFDISWRVAQKIIDKEKELFPNREKK